MINPFISNNDQLLFRKNYQVIHKSPQSNRPVLLTANDSLSNLQGRNPFTSTSPRMPLRNSSVTSPPRPNSLSRSNISTSFQQFKPRGLLEEADGWKRQLESKERQKLQVYGVEGLRYNAYMVEDPARSYQRGQTDEYYQTAHPETISRDAADRYPAIRVSQQYNQKNNKSSHQYNPPVISSGGNYYRTPKTNITSNLPNSNHNIPAQQINNRLSTPGLSSHLPAKPRREHFVDEVEERPDYVMDPQRRDSGSSSSSRPSKVDMFDLECNDRFKKSMHHGSVFYTGQGQGQMMESKQNGFTYNREEPPPRPHGLMRTTSIYSEVHSFQPTPPDSLNIEGQVFHRLL